MTALSDLIARIEAAKEGSRELNHEIAVAIGWCFGGGRPKGGLWKSPDGKMNFDTVPDFSGSLDAALTLVPDDSSVTLQFDHKTSCDFSPSAEVYPYGSEPKKPSYASTPALALCIAALEAREARR